MEQLIDTRIPVKFLEVSQERARLVFSARKVANEKEVQKYNVSSSSSLRMPVAG